MSGDNSSSITLFNYLLSLIPQLVTIITAIAMGFKFLQVQNNKKIVEAKSEVMGIIQNEKQDLEKDMKGIYDKLDSLDHQYKIITDFINKSLERHDRMLERLDDKNIGRYGGPKGH